MGAKANQQNQPKEPTKSPSLPASRCLPLVDSRAAQSSARPTLPFHRSARKEPEENPITKQLGKSQQNQTTPKILQEAAELLTISSAPPRFTPVRSRGGMEHGRAWGGGERRRGGGDLVWRHPQGGAGGASSLGFGASGPAAAPHAGAWTSGGCERQRRSAPRPVRRGGGRSAPLHGAAGWRTACASGGRIYGAL